MKRNFRTTWRSSRAITLVEVLAGTALLGTLLVASLVAGARMKAQNRQARDAMEGCKVAQDLLQTFWSKRDQFPRQGEGEVKDHAPLRWRTKVVENIEADKMGGQVVQLDVFLPDHEQSPAATVQVVLEKLESNDQEP